jgi:hypothetical protein
VNVKDRDLCSGAQEKLTHKGIFTTRRIYDEHTQYSAKGWTGGGSDLDDAGSGDYLARPDHIQHTGKF